MAPYFSPYDSIPSETEFGDFSGQDVDGWLCQIENFFNRYLMAPEQRLAVIHNFLAGEATYWHYEMYMSRRLTTWESFVTDLRHRFKPTKTLINQQEVIEEPDAAVIDLSTIVAEKSDGDKETDIVAVADTEVTSGIYSADFSSMLMLNDAEMSEECFGTKFCSVKYTLASCLPPICENDSVKVLSLFVTKIWCCIQPFVIATKPPPKPPEASLNMLGQINQVLSIASKISCDMFKSIRFPGSSKKDAASTKCLVFVSWFISVYIIELSRFHLPLTECVKSGVSALLDVVALVGSIDEYGICITVGLKNGDKDEISCYFRLMGNNHWPFAIVVRSESKLLCSIKLELSTGNTIWFSRLQTNAFFNELCKMFDLGELSFVPQKEKGNFVMFVSLQGSGKTATWTRWSLVVGDAWLQKLNYKSNHIFDYYRIGNMHGLSSMVLLMGKSSELMSHGVFNANVISALIGVVSKFSTYWLFQKACVCKLKIVAVLYNFSELKEEAMIFIKGGVDDRFLPSLTGIHCESLWYGCKPAMEQYHIFSNGLGLFEKYKTLFMPLDEADKFFHNQADVLCASPTGQQPTQGAVYDYYSQLNPSRQLQTQVCSISTWKVILLHQQGARARIRQGSYCIRPFDEVFSNFDYMKKEHKPSENSTIIIGSFSIMVIEYCARSDIKKFMETAIRANLNMIGQSGVESYFVYFVGEKVIVTTKHNVEEQYVWVFHVSGSFTMARDISCENLDRRIKIIFFIKVDQHQQEFLVERELEDLIKHSELIGAYNRMCMTNLESYYHDKRLDFGHNDDLYGDIGVSSLCGVFGYGKPAAIKGIVIIWKVKKVHVAYHGSSLVVVSDVGTSVKIKVDSCESRGYRVWISYTILGLQIWSKNENFKESLMANLQASHSIAWSASYKFPSKIKPQSSIHIWNLLINLCGHFSPLISKLGSKKMVSLSAMLAASSLTTSGSKATYSTNFSSVDSIPSTLFGRTLSNAQHMARSTKINTTSTYMYFNNDSLVVQRMQANVSKLADLGGVTLDSQRWNDVLHNEDRSSTIVAADGLTTVQEALLENSGAKLARQSAAETNNLAGNVTIAFVILVEGLTTDGVNVVAISANPVLIVRRIELMSKALVAKPGLIFKKVDSELADVAAVSASNKYIVGNMIEEVMPMVGCKGVLTLAFSMHRTKKFVMFSLPRPPEIANLEDKVDFKGVGMIRAWKVK